MYDIIKYKEHSFLSIHISGFRKKLGQIWICPITTIYYVVAFDHVD